MRKKIYENTCAICFKKFKSVMGEKIYCRICLDNKKPKKGQKNFFDDGVYDNKPQKFYAR